MNIISCYKLLLILTTQGVHVSEYMKHINELSSINACKGKDVDLLWKVDEEENKISKLEWYFNNKSICTWSSTVEAFTVEHPYQGRIERIGKTEIRLKNVSIDDDGIYTLYPLIKWSASQNMQKIVLRILEPPTNKCTCKMGHQPDFTFEQTESYCGRPRVSLVWKRKQTFEVLGEGNHILNSTLQDKEVLCCQDGEAMKCVDDNEQFCTTVSIPYQDSERPSEDGSMQHTDSVTMPDTAGSTNVHHMQHYVLAALIVSVLTAIMVLVLFITQNCKMRKNNKDLVAHNKLDMEASIIGGGRTQENSPERTTDHLMNEENVPMMETKLFEAVIKEEPRLETKEAITVHQPMNDSEAKIEVQTQQPSTLYPTLETMKDIEMQELRQAALCKICCVKEIGVVFMPCSHSVTCAYCSIRLKQCPVCKVLIKMKMNICSD